MAWAGCSGRWSNCLERKTQPVLIMEANNAEQIEEFMQPFKMAAPVEVWPASECEEVVARDGC